MNFFCFYSYFFFFSSRRRHTRYIGDWSSDVCSSDLDLSHPLAVRRSGGETRQELATRIGAFLNATEPGATIVLGGIWADAAQELAMMTDVRVLALNPGASVEESERVGLIRADTEIPLAPGSVLGVAFDATFAPEIVS